MQAPGNLIRILVKLAAGVQLGHDNFGCRHALFLVHIDGDTAAIVADRDRRILVD